MDKERIAMPVELLRDGRGVYGIGVSERFDYKAIAWSCGIEPEPLTFERRPRDLVFRPDCLINTKPNVGETAVFAHDYAVLQKIVGGFRRGPFMRSGEEHLRQFIHHEALNRAGLPWPPRDNDHARWWATDGKQQARNRGIYHGLRCLSLHVINDLIDNALHEAADADAVKAARRFTFRRRERIYRAAALSRAALQLTETFPVLAMTIYSDDEHLRPLRNEFNWDAHKEDLKDRADRKSYAAQLVDCGARLRDVAAVMEIPMALRHIKPGVAHLASNVFCRHPDLLNFLPTTMPKQRIWLSAVNWAFHKANAEFARWAAKHVPEIPGRRDQEVRSFIADLADWVCAEGASRQFVIRPFQSSMSLRTVTTLSAEWHEAVAAGMDGPAAAFPPPWYPAAKIGDYDIVPIENSAALYREGAAMHHCVGTYSDEVHSGSRYLYGVHRDGQRVATLALARDPTSTKARLLQLRGPCNAQPPKAVTLAVQR